MNINPGPRPWMAHGLRRLFDGWTDGTYTRVRVRQDMTPGENAAQLPRLLLCNPSIISTAQEQEQHRYV